MPFIPPPDPISTGINQDNVRNARNNRPPMPTVDHSEFYRLTKFSRRIGEHVAPYAADGTEDLQAIAFIYSVVMLFHVVRQNWETVAAFLLIIVLNLLSSFLAQRPELTNRPARWLCGLHFRTLRDSAAGRPIRRFLGPTALFVLIGLIFLSFTPAANRHHRPPLVDPRMLSKSGCWDYLRENNYFRDPPPAAQTSQSQKP